VIFGGDATNPLRGGAFYVAAGSVAANDAVSIGGRLVY
jgi:hypothetical protein